jgi:nucleotide-binding universal stress UspA family protein
MFKHVLIPTDGSELSGKAVASGAAFAKSIGARITFITSSPPWQVAAITPVMVTDTKEQYAADMEDVARKMLAQAEGVARAAGVACESVHVFNEHPYQAIIDTARARDCDVVLMASHGRRGAAALVLGSETQKVLTHCKLPVLVWR